MAQVPVGPGTGLGDRPTNRRNARRSDLAESLGLGHGSTFRVRLPLAAVGEQGSGAGAVEQPPAGQGRGIRILLIEDLDDILFLMKTELERMGHTVSTATNGQRGLEAAKA